ncbi:Efflux ABC transporter, ATP-binding protein [Olavius algarvensis associated proteobacterium Delta 3]|nr:Efflux ABC transporter, ATP-binding protein [Olavius algarvensis associated proteobacterium Delta 3]CAB5130281.1 Efflux ABC transporter, ATP-binding protein [Olavius algarvensis associated proteobacterium Delta 3]
MTPILEVNDLVKRYPDVTAVDGISFAIEPGICFGLLGPNGAGKTTTIEIAEGIITPTSGEILYKGIPRAKGFYEEIGIQFQSTSLLDFLTVRESLETFRNLYKTPMALQTLVEFCQLEDILDKRHDRISGGQRQRLLIAIALVNNPELLFLDEPTTGLDPQARRHLWGIVETIKSEGKTIILTTHYMEEAQHLCNNIAIIDQGKIIKEGTTEQLLQEDCCEMSVRIPSQAIPDALDRFMETLRNNGGVERWASRQDVLDVTTRDINSLMDSLRKQGIDLTNIRVRSKNLEDIFLELTGRQLRD